MIRFICGFYLLISSCPAIVWHADQETAPQKAPEGAMRNIARLHFTKARVFGGCGVQISDRWVLTAKHAVRIWKPKSLQVRVGDERLTVKRIVLHPDKDTDLALLELSKPSAAPEKITLSRGTAAKGAKLWLGGFGKSGPAGKAGFAGKFAAGFNRLEETKNKRGKLVLDKGVAGEVMPTRFDSGSPVFVKTGKAWHLFGITVTASNSKNPNYGDRSHHQLVALEIDWIAKTMAP